MKKIVFTLAFLGLCLFFSGAKAQGEAAPVTVPNGQTVEQPTVPLTTIRIVNPSYDFGVIKQGESVAHTFEFVNDGEHDLIIENVKPSCGCTAPNWTKEPVKPGATGKIEMVFNSTGKMGKQSKYLTVTYNGTPNVEQVSFTGEIVPVEQPANVQPVEVIPTNPTNNTKAPGQ